MSLKCGIVGLPNVGKSTLFNSLTNSQSASENYPFCTIDPNTSLAKIYDHKLYELSNLFDSAPVIHPTVQFTDIAGLVKGASKGEGLGNQFLAHIRQVDLLVHVIRLFEDDQIIHVDGKHNPINDLETVNYEFIMADLNTIEKAIQKSKKLSKSQPKKDIDQYLDYLTGLQEHLNQGNPAISFYSKKHDNSSKSKNLSDSVDLTNQSEIYNNYLKNLHLISAKKQLIVCNISDPSTQNTHNNKDIFAQISKIAKSYQGDIIKLPIKLESELSEINDYQERLQLLKELNMQDFGLNILSNGAYELLDLFHFYTAGKKEIKAWTIKVGSNARQAAGKIHSDMQKGFICAQIYNIDNLIKLKTLNNLKENGLINLVGQDYVVKKGDVIEFRFNV